VCEEISASTSLWQRDVDCNVKPTARRLVLDQPHHPAGRDRSADKQNKTEGAEANHHARLGSLCDAKHNRGEQREEQHCSKVRDGHERFLPVASECASTAEMMFNKPATTMNLVP